MTRNFWVPLLSDLSSRIRIATTFVVCTSDQVSVGGRNQQRFDEPLLLGGAEWRDCQYARSEVFMECF